MARRRLFSRFRRSAPTAQAPTVIVQRQPGPGRVRSAGRRVAKSLKSAGQMSYAAVSSDIGVQVGCEVAEVTASLLKGAMDMVSASSESKVDDTAFPVIQKVTGSAVRFLADRYISKKHPGLSKVMSAFGSAMNGAVALDFLRAHGVKATRVAAERLQDR